MITQLPQLVDELLRYRESPKKDTRLFRKLKHNRDLCPAVETQVNRIIDCYVKFHNIAYDVQGINDRGTDVVLRYDAEPELEESIKRYIAFQIKSFGDLNSEHYLREIKAQKHDAQEEYGERLEHYYILLCTDKLTHGNKIRQIKKTFGTAASGTVIDPTYAWTFIHLNPLRVNAIVDSILREEDVVHKKAKKMVEDFTLTETAVLLSAVYELTIKPNNVLRIEAVQELNFVKKVFRMIPDYPRDYFFFSDVTYDYGHIEDLDQEDIEDIERIYGVTWNNGEFRPPQNRKRDFYVRFEEDIDKLNGVSFSTQEGSGEIELNPEYAYPLQAVLLDAMVRYDYSGDDLLEYTLNALCDPDKCEFSEFK